ncbi:MAG: flagellar biosynthesis protein FlhB [Agathobacter sp.]
MLNPCIDDKKINYILPYNLQWFANDEGGEKTEPATQKKLEDARKEGKVAKSKELTAAFDLIVLFLVLKFFVGYVGNGLLEIFSFVYGNMDDFVKVNRSYLSAQAVSGFLMNMILKWMMIVLPFFIFGVAITLLISIFQVGWKVSAKPMEPKLSKFNPINGFKRIFSKDSIFNLLMSIVKIALIGIVAYNSIKDKANELFILYDMPLNQAIGLIGEIIIDTGLMISIVYLLVGIADFIYQRIKFRDEMKMSKQEVKDEYKNTEGDPQVKGQQKRRMQEASRRRMMQDVPKADVVITNPTHIAVALKYDPDVSPAPYLLAKGEEYVAQRIKEVAKENGIEIVENKPLARMIYANVDIGAEIPPELYHAVAEVLAMLYNAKHPNG